MSVALLETLKTGFVAIWVQLWHQTFNTVNNKVADQSALDVHICMVPIHMMDKTIIIILQSKLWPDALAVCRAHRGLPVGFLLLRYSVLFTVESLSLLYLLVIS